MVVSLSPASAVAGQGDLANYIVQLTNVGTLEDHFYLAVTGLPAGVYPSFGQNGGYLDVPPGASNARDITLSPVRGSGHAPRRSTVHRHRDVGDQFDQSRELLRGHSLSSTAAWRSSLSPTSIQAWRQP